MSFVALQLIETLPIFINFFFFCYLKLHFVKFKYIGAEVVFHIAIQKVSGYFELTENDQLVASGYVYTQKGVQNITYNSIATDAVDEDDVLLDTDDLYKEYYLRGYNYRGIFQSLIEANMSGWYIFLLLYHVYY